ncbi:HAD family hydrolase [Mycobacterium vicinigordonae]|uniref:HAD family phosphatase n=1 Tax=Mycobacterium vicinigordonae TaxID=1719132 RepID=A0A7D6E216_9MYCO|nr:HAD family phosphatase [Mycobacterium vicinigordonae]QLL09808.1 HAD family phosphatase [Mycobacterium vicinigordonae]
MHSDPHRAPALLIDFGGVLTESVLGAFERSCVAHGVEPAAFLAEAFSADHLADSPFALVELGQISIREFVDRVTPVLRRHSSIDVDGAAWLRDVQQSTQPIDPRMVQEVGALMDHGVQTALVSNSWGPRETYPWDRLPPFSEVVVSAEVGIRKPDPAIYLLAAAKLGRAPAECVFVDDLEINLIPARRLGMTAIHHEHSANTVTALRRIYGV